MPERAARTVSSVSAPGMSQSNWGKFMAMMFVNAYGPETTAGQVPTITDLLRRRTTGQHGERHPRYDNSLRHVWDLFEAATGRADPVARVEIVRFLLDIHFDSPLPIVVQEWVVGAPSNWVETLVINLMNAPTLEALRLDALPDFRPQPA